MSGDRGLVCLDYDGVLVDSAEHLLTLLRRAHASVGSGRPATREDLSLIENLSFVHLAERCGVAPADVPRYTRAMFALQGEDEVVPDIFPGVDAMLAALAARHHVAIVTASLEANVRHVLAAHGVEQTVALVLDGAGSEDKATRIGRAAARFSADLALTWMVGDAISDIRAGQAAGVATIAVTWGYQPRARLAAEQPTHLADSAADIVRITTSV